MALFQDCTEIKPTNVIKKKKKKTGALDIHRRNNFEWKGQRDPQERHEDFLDFEKMEDFSGLK